jgi:hypothetical protein
MSDLTLGVTETGVATPNDRFSRRVHDVARCPGGTIDHIFLGRLVRIVDKSQNALEKPWGFGIAASAPAAIVVPRGGFGWAWKGELPPGVSEAWVSALPSPAAELSAMVAQTSRFDVDVDIGAGIAETMACAGALLHRVA